jgi:hypothetical protein
MLVEGDVERAFSETLPSERRLLRDLRAGTLLVDRTMTGDLERLLGEQHVPRLGRVPPALASHAEGAGQDLVQGSAVCVLGMHRSGTSVLARTLNLLGVDLGPRHHLTPPDEYYPEGYLEHRDLVRINDQILRRFGGTWDRPPACPLGWEASDSLADLREAARDLLRASFAKAPLWGWKDPRTCLTLPFWQSLLPPMRYVISLRSPLSVGHSLERRDGLSMEESGRLWLVYMTSALTHTEGRARLIVPYERLLAEHERKTRRLADFIDHAAGLTPEAREAIGATIQSDLWHHTGSLERAIETAVVPCRRGHFT